MNTDRRFSSAGVARTTDAAYQHCEALARSHYENFTVASPLLPRDQRRHVFAIYAFCRFVDDLGDEAPAPVEAAPQSKGGASAISGGATTISLTQQRLTLLDRWQQELEACYRGRPTHPVMIALQHTIQSFDIPQEPFYKLIEANRMDQRLQRYPTYDDLLRYCDHSANPVGRLVLYLFGYRDPQRQQLADLTCTALQLTNFWQDLARDYAKGRIYLPQEDMARFGYSELDLSRGVVNDAFRQLMAFQVQRARELFREGHSLVKLVSRPVRLDVDLFTRGGSAVLDAIQRQGYDVFRVRPTLSRRKKAVILMSSWVASRLGRGAYS